VLKNIRNLKMLPLSRKHFGSNLMLMISLRAIAVPHVATIATIANITTIVSIATIATIATIAAGLPATIATIAYCSSYCVLLRQLLR
jgi:hypothetical protein